MWLCNRDFRRRARVRRRVVGERALARAACGRGGFLDAAVRGGPACRDGGCGVATARRGVFRREGEGGQDGPHEVGHDAAEYHWGAGVYISFHRGSLSYDAMGRGSGQNATGKGFGYG